jgi:hypothetical protein
MLAVKLGHGAGLRRVLCRVVVGELVYVLAVQRAGRIVGVLLSRLAVNPTRRHASGYTLGARSRRSLLSCFSGRQRALVSRSVSMRSK